MEPPSGDDEGNEAGGPDSGWEIGDEVGDEASGPAGRPGQDVGDEAGEAAGSAGQNTGNEPDGSQGGGGGPVDELERALGELDGEILDERVAAAGTQRSPGGTSGGAETNVVPSPPIAEPDPPQPPIPLPPDQPDARDDDVVARQLREAAMAETDPELQEQLWEEYRRYKSGL